MLRIDARVRVDLQGIIVVRRVFEKTVEGIEHLVRKEEEEFTGQTTVVKTVFSVELDHQTLLQIRSRLAHNLMVRVFEDMRSPDLDMALPTDNAEGGLRAEVDELATEITLVLRHVLVQGRGQARIVPGGSLRVMVDKVDSGGVCESHFPS
jgi:hypothetical protein